MKIGDTVYVSLNMNTEVLEGTLINILKEPDREIYLVTFTDGHYYLANKHEIKNSKETYKLFKRLSVVKQKLRDLYEEKVELNRKLKRL